MFRRLLLVAVLVFTSIAQAQAAEKILVTVNQFVNHPALDAVTSGVEKSLLKRGFLPNKVEIRIDNAQGSVANAVQIAKHQASLNPAVMVAVATPSAQACLKSHPVDTIVAFGAVTDPKAAGLVDQKNVIGVSDLPPIEGLLNLVAKDLPKAKRIGVLYNPGEVNSLNMAEKMEDLATKRGYKVEKAVVNSTANIAVAVQKLAPDVDVVYVPQDNLVVSAIDMVVKNCTAAKVPVIGNDPSLVSKGLLFALGSNYYADGLKLGEMIADHLSGKEIKKNITTSGAQKLEFNDNIAAKLGIKISLKLKLQDIKK